ncbi:hypothetical protein MRB53_037896 [Persea americana]|nr:hypothetical protein MRB53_037896 [Persea americana]
MLSSKSGQEVSEQRGLSLQSVTHWLMARLTTFVEEPDEDEDAEVDDMSEAVAQSSKTQLDASSASFQNAAPSQLSAELLVERPTQSESVIGFNGRPNKMADTCYAFWVGGSLAVSRRRALAEV